jgi:hypothetical protein
MGLADQGDIPQRVLAAEAHALSFYHVHTAEKLSVVYREHGELVPGALEDINVFLRDFRTGEVHSIDPPLLDTLHALCVACGGGTFEIISGYRSPRTIHRGDERRRRAQPAPGGAGDRRPPDRIRHRPAARCGDRARPRRRGLLPELRFHPSRTRRARLGR